VSPPFSSLRASLCEIMDSLTHVNRVCSSRDTGPCTTTKPPACSRRTAQCLPTSRCRTVVSGLSLYDTTAFGCRGSQCWWLWLRNEGFEKSQWWWYEWKSWRTMR
jgi:hypothetical protein